VKILAILALRSQSEHGGQPLVRAENVRLALTHGDLDLLTPFSLQPTLNVKRLAQSVHFVG